MKLVGWTGWTGWSRSRCDRPCLAARGTLPHEVFHSWGCSGLCQVRDTVVECARQSAASTPLWSCPKRHPLTFIRIPIRSTASHEEPRNPQQGHLRPLNKWQNDSPHPIVRGGRRSERSAACGAVRTRPPVPLVTGRCIRCGPAGCPCCFPRRFRTRSSKGSHRDPSPCPSGA